MTMINKTYTCVITLVLMVITANAQYNGNALLKQVEERYKNLEAFQKEVTYKMFYGNSKTPSESYTGEMVKTKDVEQIKILGSEVLQFPQMHILVDNKAKQLVCSKAVQNMPQQVPLDISQFLNVYTIVSERVNGNTMVLNMNLNKAAIHIPYKRISIFINKDTLEIQKQVLYFSGEFTGTETAIASENVSRLEVSFKSLTVEAPPVLNHYVTLTSDKKIKPSAKFAGYKIIDQTHL